MDGFKNESTRNFKHLNLMLEHLADAVWVANQKGVILDANQKATVEVGYTIDELKGMSIEDIDPTIKKIGFDAYLQNVLEKGMISYSGRSICKSGEIIDIEVSASTLMIEGEMLYISTTRNVTEEKRKAKELEDLKHTLSEKIIELEAMNQALIKSERQNSAILNVLPDLLFVYDAKGTFIDCKVSETSALILPPKDFLGKNLSDIMPSDIADKAKLAIKKTLQDNQVQRFEYSLEIDDDVMHFETRMVKSADQEVLAIVRDITSLKREQDLIIDLSYKDHLTGLYNRRYLDEMIDKSSHDRKFPSSVLMIDVNGLKLTNDAFGHLVGDKLLMRVATILKETCPLNSIITRIGGDEFVVITDEFDSLQTEALVEKLYERLKSEKVDEVFVSVSIGWEVRNSKEMPFRDAFIRAENFMFRRKLIESQSMRNQTIKAIMVTLNEKREREKRHSEQVSIIARRIGVKLGLGEQAIKELEITGLLHDIGKIVVKDEILNKPGKLTSEEYDEIKRHSESGYQILKSVDAYSSLADDILAHHERYDGTGYPRGLKGNDIPIAARIIAVADAYEAMISDRTYRKGMDHDLAIVEIKKNSGIQFDPEIVAAFIDLMKEW